MESSTDPKIPIYEISGSQKHLTINFRGNPRVMQKLMIGPTCYPTDRAVKQLYKP